MLTHTHTPHAFWGKGKKLIRDLIFAFFLVVMILIGFRFGLYDEYFCKFAKQKRRSERTREKKKRRGKTERGGKKRRENKGEPALASPLTLALAGL